MIILMKIKREDGVIDRFDEIKLTIDVSKAFTNSNTEEIVIRKFIKRSMCMLGKLTRDMSVVDIEFIQLVNVRLFLHLNMDNELKEYLGYHRNIDMNDASNKYLFAILNMTEEEVDEMIKGIE